MIDQATLKEKFVAKPKIKEWVLTDSVSFSGARIIVEARTEEEARGKAAQLDGTYGVDTSDAIMDNWNWDECEPNE